MGSGCGGSVGTWSGCFPTPEVRGSNLSFKITLLLYWKDKNKEKDTGDDN